MDVSPSNSKEKKRPEGPRDVEGRNILRVIRNSFVVNEM
jgi:hypothetical protein